jgi:uncharacterized protein DUF1236
MGTMNQQRPFFAVAGHLSRVENKRNTPMRKLLLSIGAATMLFAGSGLAFADGEAPAWNANQGTMMTTHYTTMKYTSYRDANMHPTVGMVLPETVTVYDMPDTMKDPSYSNYRYGMINDHPVVVERTTRKIVHTWD